MGNDNSIQPKIINEETIKQCSIINNIINIVKNGKNIKHYEKYEDIHVFLFNNGKLIINREYKFIKISDSVNNFKIFPGSIGYQKEDGYLYGYALNDGFCSGNTGHKEPLGWYNKK